MSPAHSQTSDNTHICDNSVTIVAGHEILHCTRWCILQLVTTDEVVCKVELRSIGRTAVHDWHRAVGVRLGTVAIDFGHCCVVLFAARC